MRLFKKRSSKKNPADRSGDLAAAVTVPDRHSLRSLKTLQHTLNLSRHDYTSGRYRIRLYRFLAESVPVIGACIWTWSRLCAAPGRFRVLDPPTESTGKKAEDRLESLTERFALGPSGRHLTLAAWLVDLFTCLFRDGHYGGFLAVHRDTSGVDCFVPVDPIDIIQESDHPNRLQLERDQGAISLERPDFFHLALNHGLTAPLGRSILSSVPFVSYIQQQLVDDMRRASHNAGYHRLHVKVTAPERLAGETDSAYTERINAYFDGTVKMMRDCDITDNPVTWDDVNIEYIGPEHTRSVSSQWFLNHRAMIEEICAGTHLAPFLLGYSYGDTTTWSSFKFDVVMRQVRSVQNEAARLLERIGNIDLALAGIDARCRFEFDNTFAYEAGERAGIQAQQVDSLIKLYDAGLVDQETAQERAGDLL